MTERSLVYAEAMFELAVEENKLEDIWVQLSTISDAISENHMLVNLLSNPSISKDERRKIVDTIFADADTQLKSFFKLLIDRGVVISIMPCIEHFYKLYCDKMGIVSATAITAVPLNETQKQNLINKLELALNKKVELKTKLDTSIIGGVKLQLADKELEASISSRLSKLSKQLESSV